MSRVRPCPQCPMAGRTERCAGLHHAPFCRHAGEPRWDASIVACSLALAGIGTPDPPAPPATPRGTAPADDGFALLRAAETCPFRTLNRESCCSEYRCTLYSKPAGIAVCIECPIPRSKTLNQ